MKNIFTVSEAFELIKSQLESIRVSGQDVRTLASVFDNIDNCIAATRIPAPQEVSKPEEGERECTQ